MNDVALVLNFRTTVISSHGGGVVRPGARPPSVPYEEEEEGDIVPEDADDIHIEIRSYKFQEGDFVWHVACFG